MALPSPTADFPDLSGTVAASQARARELMNSAWMGMAGIGQRAVPAAVEAPPSEEGYGSLSGYSDPQRGPYMPRSGRGRTPGISDYGTQPPDSGDPRDLLARTIQGEAGGEGYEGMLAVGAVIGNRVRSGRYGGSTLNDVIMAPGQFSMWNGVTGYAGGQGAIDPGRIQVTPEAYKAADAILAGGYADPTNGATHYYNPQAANPKWGQAQAGGDWTPLGNHLFGWADGRPGAHPKG